MLGSQLLATLKLPLDGTAPLPSDEYLVASTTGKNRDRLASEAPQNRVRRMSFIERLTLARTSALVIARRQ